MPAADLLSRLDRVQPRGHGRWMARCPAHDDRGPSLSVRELDDGRVLVHCFAECPVDDVLAAVGLEMDALFPPRSDPLPRARRPWAPMDVLRAIRMEALVAAVAASQLAQGADLTDNDRARLWTAVGRLERAAELAADA